MSLPYRRCQISSPNKKVGAKEPFQPTVKTPMHGGEEDGQIFFKKLYLLCGSNLTTNRPLQNTPVTTERTITPPSRLGALRWVGHRLRLEKRSRASKEWKRMVKFKSTFEAMKLPACPSFDPC